MGEKEDFIARVKAEAEAGGHPRSLQDSVYYLQTAANRHVPCRLGQGSVPLMGRGM